MQVVGERTHFPRGTDRAAIPLLEPQSLLPGPKRTTGQGKESTKIVASWIRDEKLDTIIPNEPKITSGHVVATSDRVLVAV